MCQFWTNTCTGICVQWNPFISILKEATEFSFRYSNILPLSQEKLIHSKKHFNFVPDITTMCFCFFFFKHLINILNVHLKRWQRCSATAFNIFKCHGGLELKYCRTKPDYNTMLPYNNKILISIPSCLSFIISPQCDSE